MGVDTMLESLKNWFKGFSDKSKKTAKKIEAELKRILNK